MANGPTILNPAMTASALVDEKFYQQVPEFIPMKSKLTAMRVQTAPSRGCSGCAKTRIQRSMHNEFLTLIQALSPEAVQRLKAYFKITQLMLNTVNPITNQVGVKLL